MIKKKLLSISCEKLDEILEACYRIESRTVKSYLRNHFVKLCCRFDPVKLKIKVSVNSLKLRVYWNTLHR